MVDNRLYDLIPPRSSFPGGILPIGYETLGVGGPRATPSRCWSSPATNGVMPRVFGVNHHPEIVDRGRQLMILEQKRERGEVSREWYDERAEILTEDLPRREQRPAAPPHLGLHAARAAALPRASRRAPAGRSPSASSVDLHEDRVLEAAGVL